MFQEKNGALSLLFEKIRSYYDVIVYLLGSID